MAKENSHDLSAKFQQSACPADLPIYDSGISPQGLKLPLDKVIATAAPHTDVFMYGDTDHYNLSVRGEMQKPENLAALKKSGFTDIAFETSKGLQSWNNAYVDGGLNRDELKAQISPALIAAKGNEKGEWTKQILDTAEFAKANGMNLHFADPNNGSLACDAALSAEECDIAKTKDRYQDTQLSADHAARLAEPAADNQQRKIFQLHTTCATPPALAADLEQAAAQPSLDSKGNDPVAKKLEVSSLSR